MQLEEKTLLHDILIAAERINTFTHGKDFADYRSDDMMRAAVERQFEIIGEALNRLSQKNPDLVSNARSHAPACECRPEQKILKVTKVLGLELSFKTQWQSTTHFFGSLAALNLARHSPARSLQA